MPLYFMPTGTVTVGDKDKIIAKYTSTFKSAGFSVTMIQFGNNPHGLVYSPCDAATDTAVQANADVRRLPDDLESNPGQGAVDQLQTFLENNNIPAGWVSTSLTWREITRGVVQIFLFIQRYTGDCNGPAVFTGGVTLNSTFASLPLAVRQALQCSATAQNFDTSSLTGASTLRQILRTMGQQWGNTPIFCGIEI